MKQVAAALVKAQKQFGPALKTSSNPHYKTKYADLSACIEAVIEALNENGIMLMQRTLPGESGITVETVFIHESGEQVTSGPLHVPASKQDPQGYGSALTYARRYSLMAACGIAPEDDDGNAAVKAKREEEPNSLANQLRASIKAAQIKPTVDAGKGMSEERKSAIEEVALYLVDCHKGGNDAEAVALWYAQDTFQDNEERIYCWSLLQAESKLRSTIKSNRPVGHTEWAKA